MGYILIANIPPSIMFRIIWDKIQINRCWILYCFFFVLKKNVKQKFKWWPIYLICLLREFNHLKFWASDLILFASLSYNITVYEVEVTRPPPIMLSSSTLEIFSFKSKIGIFILFRFFNQVGNILQSSSIYQER